MPQMLVALDFSLSKPRQIVIAARKDAPETKALLTEVHRHFLPNTILLLADIGEGQKYLGEENEAIRAMTMVNGKPAAYVCENFTCNAPVTDPDNYGIARGITAREFCGFAVGFKTQALGRDFCIQ